MSCLQVDIKKSYHCSPDCLREHWAFHRDFHQQSRENGEVWLMLRTFEAGLTGRQAGRQAGRWDGSHQRSREDGENSGRAGQLLHVPQ